MLTITTTIGTYINQSIYIILQRKATTTHLEMVRSKHKPATEAVASKYHQDAYGVSQHIREALLEGQNQHLGGMGEVVISQHNTSSCWKLQEFNFFFHLTILKGWECLAHAGIFFYLSLYLLIGHFSTTGKNKNGFKKSLPSHKNRGKKLNIPYIISLKKAQVAQAAEPDQQVTEPKEEGADVPRVQEAFVTLQGEHHRENDIQYFSRPGD